jgi:hypothetical protein
VGVTLKHVNVIETVDIINDHGHFFEVSRLGRARSQTLIRADHGIRTVRLVLVSITLTCFNVTPTQNSAMTLR